MDDGGSGTADSNSIGSSNAMARMPESARKRAALMTRFARSSQGAASANCRNSNGMSLSVELVDALAEALDARGHDLSRGDPLRRLATAPNSGTRASEDEIAGA